MYHILKCPKTSVHRGHDILQIVRFQGFIVGDVKNNCNYVAMEIDQRYRKHKIKMFLKDPSTFLN